MKMSSERKVQCAETRCLTRAAAMAVIGLAASVTSAGTINFTGDGTSVGIGYQNTTWPDVNNWQGGILPGSNDTAAFIDASNGVTTWSGVTLNGDRTIGAIDIVMGGDWNIDAGSPAGTLTLTTGNITKRTQSKQNINANLIVGGDGTWLNLSGVSYTGELTFNGTISGTGSVTMAGPAGWDDSSLIAIAGNSSVALPSLTIRPRMQLRVAGSTSIDRLADTMPISLQSGGLQVTGVANAATSETIGDLGVSGLSTLLVLPSGTGTMTVNTSKLLRNDNGVLRFQSGDTLGSTSFFKVTSGVSTSNGMAAPWVLRQGSTGWNSSADMNFVNYDATNGFVPVTYTARTEADINSAASTEIVSLTKSVNDVIHNPTLTADLTIHALKLSGFGNTDIAQSGSYTLSIGSGGIISMTGDVNVAPRVNFGSAEGVVYETGPSYQAISFDGGVDGSGGLTKAGGGNVILNSSSNTFTGAVTVNEGQLTIGGNVNSADGVGLNRTGTTLSLRVARPGTFNLNGRTQRIASLDGEGGVGGGGTLTIIRDNTATSNFAGIISAAINLNKQGAGTQILGGDNTYTGATTISEGTLLVNGTTTGQGAYSVTGGILGGNGTIGLASGNSVTIVSTGHLAPGASIGTLSVNGDVNLQSGGAFDFELGNAGAADLLNVTNLTLAGTLNLSQLTGTSASGTYLLANYSGTLSGTFASVSGLPSGYSVDYGTRTAGQITLTVPEPASLSLLAMGGLALLRRRRRSV